MPSAVRKGEAMQRLCWKAAQWTPMTLKPALGALEEETRDAALGRTWASTSKCRCSTTTARTFRIMRSHHTPVTVGRYARLGAGRGTIKLTPVHSDLVRYEPLSAGSNRGARSVGCRVLSARFRPYFLRGRNILLPGADVCDLRGSAGRGRAALDVTGVDGVGRIW